MKKDFISKKKIIAFLTSIMLICSSVLFSSAKTIDEKLVVATKITRKILNVDIKDDKEKCGYISSNYVKGLDGVEDYIISQCATGGYAIFEKESMELIEYSGVGQSPYVGVETNNAYYGGPVNYFKGEHDKIENLNTGKISNKENVKEIANELKRKLKEDRGKQKEKAKKKTETNNLSSPGPTGENVVDADSYIVKSRNYISDYQFFVDNHEHGYNDKWDWSCMSVAAQLLLSYNNWAKDGRIITEQQIDGNEVFFLEGRDANRTKPYSNEMRGTTSTDLKFDEETSFYEILKGYINPTSFSDDTKPENDNLDNYDLGATLYEGYVGILNYMQKYAFSVLPDIAIDYNEKQQLGSNHVINTLKNEITANRPAIASINTYETQSDGTVKVVGHAIVVYGYQTIRYNSQDINGFIAHYGWRDRDTTNVWVNSSWFKGYLTFQTSHTHNNENVLEPKNHVFECGECNAVYAKQNHSSQFIYTLSDAKYSSWQHGINCICGYQYTKPHDLYYTYSDSIYHTVRCRDCSFMDKEEHLKKRGPLCHFCRG